MAAKIESLRSFLRGLISVTNRFSTPKGAFIQMSNLLMNERGAVQTCDGTVVTSVLPGGNTNAILALSYFVDPGFNAANNKIIGLVVKNVNFVQLYNFSTNPATLLVDNIFIDQGWFHPQMFNFAGSVVITLGAGTPTQLYTEPGGIPTLVPISTQNKWVANRNYQVGDMVKGTAVGGANPGDYAFQVISLTGFGGGFSGPAAGVSGSVEPAWPGPDAAGIANPTFDVIHPTITDNTVEWRLLDKAALAAGLLPPGGAHGISHEGALWLFGTNPTESSNGADGPMSLRQTHLNVANEWPGLYAAFVGKDDGQRATGIGSFTIAEAGIAPTGGLVLFKDYSTYNATGVFGTAPNGVLPLQPVKTDLGCIAPRTVQFVPGNGLMRLTHLGVALYNGIQDQLVSEDIRPYILGGFGITGINVQQADNARATLVSNPPMYVMAIPTGSNTWCNRILAYDLILKVWSVVELPFQISAFAQIRIPTDFSLGGGAAIPITYMGGSSDGKLRRWQAGDPSTWDTGQLIPWNLTTPEIGTETTGRMYFSRTTIRYHAPTAPMVTFQPIYGNSGGPTVTSVGTQIGPISYGANQSGNDGQQPTATYEGDMDLISRFEQRVTGQTERVKLSGTGRVTIEAIELEVVPKPTMPLGQPV